MMYTLTIEAPNDQATGVRLIETVEYWRNNPDVTVCRRYTLYKEIVEVDSIKYGVTNFPLTIKTNNPAIATILEHQLIRQFKLKGTVQ